jgi:hypothetical protein
MKLIYLKLLNSGSKLLFSARLALENHLDKQYFKTRALIIDKRDKTVAKVKHQVISAANHVLYLQDKAATVEEHVDNTVQEQIEKLDKVYR